MCLKYKGSENQQNNKEGILSRIKNATANARPSVYKQITKMVQVVDASYLGYNFKAKKKKTIS